MVCFPAICTNMLGSGVEEKKVDKLICPFDGCTSGRNGTRMAKRPEDISRLRWNLSEHIHNDGFVVPTQWLHDTGSRLCPGCKTSIVGLLGTCDGCKNRIPDSCFNVSAPIARHLPKLEQNHVTQRSYGDSVDGCITTY